MSEVNNINDNITIPVKINQAIVTEGKFDRTKLAALFDAVIIETNGFGIFSNKERQLLVKQLALSRGIIVLTDSDPAGIKIRSFINDIVKEGTVLNAYVPVIYGKEKRKERPGAAGMLGVEGIDDETILSAVKKVAVLDNAEIAGDPVIPAELFEAGLSGSDGSSIKRAAFLQYMDLPINMSTKQMLRFLNNVLGPDEFRKKIQKFNEGYTELLTEKIKCKYEQK